MEGWTLFEQICLYIAIPATLVLLIQFVLLLVGLGGGGDADADGGIDADGGDLELDGDGVPDLDGDGGPDLELEGDGADLDGDGLPDAGEADGGQDHPGLFTGLNIFTLRGFVTFFTLLGWGGLWLSRLGLHPLLAAFLAIQIGIAGMVGVALLLRWALEFQSDGTLNIRNAVGRMGEVYLTVPAAGRGSGKVNVTVQDQLREFEAVTDGAEPIPTGAEVLVVGLAGEDVLLVAPAAPEET